MNQIIQWDGKPFNGSKIALLVDDKLVTYKRDDVPHIPFPNTWDLPGGGREGDESPIECALREVAEEFEIRLPANIIHWQRAYAGSSAASLPSYFLAAHVSEVILASVQFGSEGQYWKLMPIHDFLDKSNAADFLKLRLRDYLDSQ